MLDKPEVRSGQGHRPTKRVRALSFQQLFSSRSIIDPLNCVVISGTLWHRECGVSFFIFVINSSEYGKILLFS